MPSQDDLERPTRHLPTGIMAPGSPFSGDNADDPLPTPPRKYAEIVVEPQPNHPGRWIFSSAKAPGVSIDGASYGDKGFAERAAHRWKAMRDLDQKAVETAPLLPGYRQISDEQRALIHEAKQFEERVMRFVDSIGPYTSASNGTADGRNVALARTYLEDGFMRLVRSLAQPQRIKLDGED